MKGDPKVIEYLNKGLRSELTAINQYWLHYRILDNWGFKDLAKKWQAESIEEMHHADKFAAAHPVPRRLPEHAGARSAAHRPEREGNAGLRSRRRGRSAQPLPGGRDLLPFGQGLCLARSVRGTDEGRGAPHRLPRRPSSIWSRSSASNSTRSTTSASSRTIDSSPQRGTPNQPGHRMRGAARRAFF